MSELFQGQNLVQADCRTPASADQLKGKIVAIYFRSVHLHGHAGRDYTFTDMPDAIKTPGQLMKSMVLSQCALVSTMPNVHAGARRVLQECQCEVQRAASMCKPWIAK
jgi:hypothetical protein